MMNFSPLLLTGCPSRYRTWWPATDHAATRSHTLVARRLEQAGTEPQSETELACVRTHLAVARPTPAAASAASTRRVPHGHLLLSGRLLAAGRHRGHGLEVEPALTAPAPQDCTRWGPRVQVIVHASAGHVNQIDSVCGVQSQQERANWKHGELEARRRLHAHRRAREVRAVTWRAAAGAASWPPAPGAAAAAPSALRPAHAHACKHSQSS